MQPTFIRVLLSISLTCDLALSAGAFAAELFSSPIKIEGGNHSCYLLIASDRSIQVTAQLFAWLGGGSDTQPAQDETF